MFRPLNNAFSSKRSLYFSIAFYLFLSFLSLGSVLAQPPPDGGDGGDPDTIPLDGGISLLIAAGAAYGAKKVYSIRSKNEV